MLVVDKLNTEYGAQWNASDKKQLKYTEKRKTCPVLLLPPQIPQRVMWG
jgi:hypothetical protein